MHDGRGLRQDLLEERRPPADRPVAQTARPLFRPAWFAGCDLRILARAPSDGTFYDTLGIGVLLLSCLSGFAVYFSISYVLEEQATAVAIGLAWAVVLSCGIERLLLQVAGSREHLGALVIAIAPRVFVSLLIGLALAEPLLLKVNEPEINNYIGDAQRTERRQLLEDNEATYGGRIDAGVKELNEIDEQEERLAREHNQLLQAQRECGGVSPECSTLASEAQAKAERLREIEGENERKRVPGLEADLKSLRKQHNEDQGGGREDIVKSDGVLARIEALGSLTAEHTAMNVEAWVLRLLLIFVDLLPLAVKVTRILSFESPYELQSAAARQRDALTAEAEELATDVSRQDLRDRARADKRVNQAATAADAERRIYEVTGDDRADPFDGDTPPRAMSLDEFVDSISIHEERPVEVPETLRRSGLIGLGLLGAGAVLTFLMASAFGTVIPAGWLLVVAAMLAMALCVFTRGFREAPAWAMRPIFWTYVAGLALPPTVALISLL